MSLDRSLKSGNTLAQHRNVLSRAERIARLIENEEFDVEKDEPLGLRKVANRKVSAGKKSGKKQDEAEEGVAEGAPAAEGAAEKSEQKK